MLSLLIILWTKAAKYDYSYLEKSWAWSSAIIVLLIVLFTEGRLYSLWLILEWVSKRNPVLLTFFFLVFIFQLHSFTLKSQLCSYIIFHIKPEWLKITTNASTKTPPGVLFNIKYSEYIYRSLRLRQKQQNVQKAPLSRQRILPLLKVKLSQITLSKHCQQNQLQEILQLWSQLTTAQEIKSQKTMKISLVLKNKTS